MKDVTFVLTYIWFVENGLLDLLRMAFWIRGWFYYVSIKPSFHMIVDDRYDHWDRCDRWKHSIAAIVTIAEVWFPYSRWDRSDRRIHTIAVIVTIVEIAVLWFPYDGWDRYDRYDRCSRRDRLWFYPSDRDRCDRWQSLVSLAKWKFGFHMIVTIAEQFTSDPSDHMETRLYEVKTNADKAIYQGYQ